MRHLKLVIMTSAVLGCALAAAAHTVQRTVLLETFTNVSCAGCAGANLVTSQVVDDRSNHEVVNVQFHLNWPEAADPFYTANPADNFIRAFYYEIADAPDLITGGVNKPVPGNADDLSAAIDDCRDMLTPLSMVVAYDLDGADLTVAVGIKAVAPPPAGELRLHVAVVDELEHYDTPPGDNGETDFHWTMRDQIPNFNGTCFTIDEGDSLTFNLPSTVDPAWLDTDLQVVAWVQDFDTKEVLQAATSAPPLSYAASYYAERYGKVSPVDELFRFDGWVVNAGALSDTYDFHMDVDAPGWQVSACAGTTCYPPWVTDFSVELAPDAEEIISIDVTPSTNGATGTITMSLTSRGDRDLRIDRTFVLITPGSDLLYVDTDEANGYAPYFTAAMDAAGATWSAWDVKAMGRPDALDFGVFTKVVWNTEAASPGLTDADRGALGTYLAGGGDLMLSGQDLAFGLCDPLSPHRTPAAAAWYEQHTGAVYVADDAQDSSVSGAAGDPVGDGLAFSLAGGDGAGNQDYPDVLSPRDNARSALDYSPGNSAAVRFGLGDARVVTLGFGFEGISAAADRNALMASILAWFDDTTVGASAGASPPLRLSGAAAHPNPFNPATTLSFALAGDGAAETHLDIFDV
ncbi:hypothetical protein KKA85_07095, partial [bacterium]|nr:hypothetical protein [bacterium]